MKVEAWSWSSNSLVFINIEGGTFNVAKLLNIKSFLTLLILFMAQNVFTSVCSRGVNVFWAWNS